MIDLEKFKKIFVFISNTWHNDSYINKLHFTDKHTLLIHDLKANKSLRRKCFTSDVHIITFPKNYKLENVINNGNPDLFIILCNDQDYNADIKNMIDLLDDHQKNYYFLNNNLKTVKTDKLNEQASEGVPMSSKNSDRFIDDYKKNIANGYDERLSGVTAHVDGLDIRTKSKIKLAKDIRKLMYYSDLNTRSKITVEIKYQDTD